MNPIEYGYYFGEGRVQVSPQMAARERGPKAVPHE